jgi:hypothetical protein
MDIADFKKLNEQMKEDIYHALSSALSEKDVDKEDLKLATKNAVKVVGQASIFIAGKINEMEHRIKICEHALATSFWWQFSKKKLLKRFIQMMEGRIEFYKECY